jgi:hypothetical protein
MVSKLIPTWNKSVQICVFYHASGFPEESSLQILRKNHPTRETRTVVLTPVGTHVETHGQSRLRNASTRIYNVSVLMKYNYHKYQSNTTSTNYRVLTVNDMYLNTPPSSYRTSWYITPRVNHLLDNTLGWIYNQYVKTILWINCIEILFHIQSFGTNYVKIFRCGDRTYYIMTSCS